MRITQNNINKKFHLIPESIDWNNPINGNSTFDELKMHKIHAYPAKFPSFLITKSLEYAISKKIEIKSVGDIFCGCGTTALEAKYKNKNFWGCDISPVATLIAKVKSNKYNGKILNKYFTKIIEYDKPVESLPEEIIDNERLSYWFDSIQLYDLYNLLKAIKSTVPNGKYQSFFLVAFSNILKRTSRWLTKSIKPQIDPQKIRYDVYKAFKDQCKQMEIAVEEVNKKINFDPSSKIIRSNILNYKSRRPLVDMLITSPPYVTSYEYADLHQLSTMWLGYAKDFRSLRNGTIGSLYHSKDNKIEITKLDPIAIDIYSKLQKAKSNNPKAVLKYFNDISNVVKKSYRLVKPGGLAIFVIGNTTHKGVYIDNAKFLTKCMLNSNYSKIEVFKRKISSKILTPYRDNRGKFSSNKSHRKVYNYEYIVIGRKLR